MRVGYFGGSFDPPHLGHLAVARAARDRFHLDRILLAPTGRQPLKPNGPQASFPDRLHMTELLCGGEPSLEASAIDGPQPDGRPNYTVETLRRLRSSLTPPSPETCPTPGPDPSLIFAIVGADAFAGLGQWRDPLDLLRLAEWIVVSRPGSPLSALKLSGWDRSDLTQTGLNLPVHPQIHLLDDLAVPVSATLLRARLNRGEDCHGPIPAPVLQYIRTHHLYVRL